MKQTLVLIMLLMTIMSCSPAQNQAPVGVQNLILIEQDLQQLGMTMNTCQTDEYETSPYSPLAQYSFCNYTIDSLDTEVIIELKKFTNQHDRNGSYQYESSHLVSSEGIIRENEYGDMSKFYANSDNDYGGEFNEPGIYYYHLYIAKDEYLMHITSKGKSEDAQVYIANIGKKIISKFK